MTTFAPLAPTLRVPPTQVAADTWLIHSVQPALGQPLFVYLNSMVILAFSRIRELPSLDPPEMPDQSVLDQIIAASAEPKR